MKCVICEIDVDPDFAVVVKNKTVCCACLQDLMDKADESDEGYDPDPNADANRIWNNR